jgi:hypothetical protein
MNAIRHLLVGNLGAACLLAAAVAQAQNAGQEPPVGTEMPSTQHQQEMVRPVPDVHGRSGGGTGQQHGNDAASPSAGSVKAAARGGPCETDMPASAHQQQTLKTAQDCPDQGGASATGAQTGEQPAAQSQQ